LNSLRKLVWMAGLRFLKSRNTVTDTVKNLRSAWASVPAGTPSTTSRRPEPAASLNFPGNLGESDVPHFSPAKFSRVCPDLVIVDNPDADSDLIQINSMASSSNWQVCGKPWDWYVAMSSCAVFGGFLSRSRSALTILSIFTGAKSYCATRKSSGCRHFNAVDLGHRFRKIFEIESDDSIRVAHNRSGKECLSFGSGSESDSIRYSKFSTKLSSIA
jgi:hypothetical protein